ncbi:MAG: creatininase family protein [candidate division WS1 bacterium]|nr:creatininase family protein [candidate division WS1 bacterium]
MPLFADMTSPEIGQWAEKNALVLLPVGQIEEHGDHLPVNTDAVIAESVTRAAAEQLDADLPVLVLPVIWAGYSGTELSRWPGTLRVRTRTLADYIYDIIFSLTEMGFSKIATVNGHGHHPALLEMVAREIADATGVYMACVEVAKMAAPAVVEMRKSAPGGCIHGGEFETSLMLYLEARVQMDRAHAEDVFRHHSKHFPGDGFAGSKAAFWSTWGIQRSTTGIYGDPTVADAEFGRQVFETTVDNLCSFLREYHATEPACWD